MGIILKQLGVQSRNLGSSFGTTWLSDTGEWIDSINPANNALIASTSITDAENYQQIVDAKQQAQVSWSQIPAPKRAEIVRLIGEALRGKKDFIGTLISLETGKAKCEGDKEVQDMIDMADLAVGQARMLHGALLPAEQLSHRVYEQWLPMGVCGIITDFATPAFAWASHAFLAVIAGNVVLWKPSTKTPLVAIAIHHICQAAMDTLEVEGIFSLINSDEPNFLEDMVNDSRIALIAFRGSREVGNRIQVKTASRGARCLASYRGNHSVIIDPSADMNWVLDALIEGVMHANAQLSRLIVHEQLIDSLIARLQHAYGQLRCGDPLEAGHQLGPLIDEASVSRYTQLIARIKAQGGKLLFGGELVQMAGNFVQPTLVLADASWPLLQQEHGLPVIGILPYKCTEEAIALNKGANRPLATSLFATDMRVVERFLSAHDNQAERVNVNMLSSQEKMICPSAWQSYMRPQKVAMNWGAIKKAQI
jgi:aldehyde dehydrogenase (NAD+)